MKKITMKSKIKRGISVLLTAAMVCTSTGVTAFAVEESAPVEETYATEETHATEETPDVESVASETSKMESYKETESAKESESTKETETVAETESTKEIESAKESESAENKDTEDESTSFAPTENETEKETSKDMTEETETAETLTEETETMTEIEEIESEVIEEDLGAAADIASGKYGDIKWVIDKGGKLTVNGTGDFSESDLFFPQWYEQREKIKTAEISVTGMTNASGMFYGCSNLTSVDLSGFDTSNVINMGYMFYGCDSLTSLNLSNFNTANVTDMEYMFAHCSNLTSLNLNNFDTTNVANMSGMFVVCSNLKSLNLGNFNTINVANMEDMFSSCDSLTSLNLSNFNTTNVTNMGRMFSFCNSLTSLDLSNFNTTNVTNMERMFWFCNSLANLDLSNFNTTNVTNMKDMFGRCKSLIHLDLSNFNTAKVTDMSYVFYNCSSLIALHTPLNVTLPIELPDGRWCDESGKVYTELPKSRASILLTKGVPNDDNYYASGNRKDFSEMNVSITDIKSVVYCGSAYTPAIKVTDTVDNKKTTLEEGTDYRVMYINNVNAGTATVLVSGNGTFTGTITKKFTISPKSIKKAKILTGTVVGSISQDADLSKLVSVYDGTKLLKHNVDYTLSIKDAAQGTVAVKGKGNYDANTEAVAKVTVYKPAVNASVKTVINPADVTLEYASTPYTGKALKPKVTVTVNKTALASKDYNVQYQNNQNAGTAFVIVTGKGSYTGKAVQPFIITPQTGDMRILLPANKKYVYNGKLQKPSFTVKVGEKKLSKKDYVATYINNIHAGTATINVEGIGNYKGLTDSETFTIDQCEISKASVKSTNAAWTIMHNKRMLVENTDYTIAYGTRNNNKVPATITGKGDFTGKMVKTMAYIPVTFVRLNELQKSLYVGDTLSLWATYYPANATDKTVEWSSDNPAVATVQYGEVRAISEGIAHITATVGGYSAECSILVFNVDVSSIQLNMTTKELYVNDTFQLEATILPSNATDKTITWSSDNPEVASVDNGIVTAVSNGTAKITAKAGYRSDTCIVRVNEHEYTYGEEWKVEGQWGFKVNSVSVHSFCDTRSDTTGAQVVTVDYTYYQYGYRGSSANNYLLMSYWDMEVMDAKKIAGSKYSCKHDKDTEKLYEVGSSCNASQAFVLQNESDTITLQVHKRTSGTLVEKWVTFTLPIGNSAQ